MEAVIITTKQSGRRHRLGQEDDKFWGGILGLISEVPIRPQSGEAGNGRLGVSESVWVGALAAVRSSAP